MIVEVSEKEFWDTLHGMGPTSTETYRNGDYNEMFGMGRGDSHRLLGVIYHTKVKGVWIKQHKLIREKT